MQRVFRERITQGKPVPQQMSSMVSRAQVFSHRGIGVERLDRAQSSSLLAACLLALADIFEIGETHLAYARLGSRGPAYVSTFENRFGDSALC